MDSSSPDNWDRLAHPMKKNDFGVFEIVIPAVRGAPGIPHNSKVKVSSLLLSPLLRAWLIFPLL